MTKHKSFTTTTTKAALWQQTKWRAPLEWSKDALEIDLQSHEKHAQTFMTSQSNKISSSCHITLSFVQNKALTPFEWGIFTQKFQ